MNGANYQPYQGCATRPDWLILKLDDQDGFRQRTTSPTKPFAVVGTTPTPYGGKWAHADAIRSA